MSLGKGYDFVEMLSGLLAKRREIINYSDSENRNLIINKTVIRTKVKLPIIEKEMFYDFHIVYVYKGYLDNEEYVLDCLALEDLHRETDEKKIEERLKLIKCSKEDYYKKFPLTDYKEELARFCHEIKEDGSVYYFNQPMDMNENKLPLFYGIMFHDDYIDGVPIYHKWAENIEKELAEHVYFERVQGSYLKNLLAFRHEIGGLLYEFFDLLKNGYVDFLLEEDENPEIELINDLCCIAQNICDLKNGKDYEGASGVIVKSLNSLQDAALRCYLAAVIDDFINYVVKNKILNICSKCNSFFPYKEGKKYCDANCLKSASNKRNYERRKGKKEDLLSEFETKK